MEIVPVRPDEPEARELIRQLDTDLVSRYPEEIVAGRAVTAPQPLELAYAQTERPVKRWFFFK